MDYPRNCIWFVRADGANEESSEGSAIAVRLRRQNASGPPQIYLLTCAHVVRKPGQSGTAGFGSCYPRIRAWCPEWGFSAIDPESGTAVEPVSEIVPTQGAVDDFYACPTTVPGHADWILLRLCNSSIAEDQSLPTLRMWSSAPAQPGRLHRIYGYPGGSLAFRAPQNKVIPNHPFVDLPTLGETDEGLIAFQGLDTRSGMSGGGVFDVSSGELVGLHRSRDDLTANLHAVSIQQVRSVLDPTWELVPGKERSSAEPSRRRFMVMGFVGIAAGAAAIRYGNLFGKGAPSSEVTCEFYDSLTRERIRKDVSLTNDSQTFARVRFGDRLPRHFFTSLEQIRIECPGYQSQAQSCSWELPDDSSLQRLCLVRDLDGYLFSITPDIQTLPLPSFRDIDRYRAENRHAPREVTLLIHNESGHRPDLLLLCESPRGAGATTSRPEFSLTVPVLAAKPGWSKPAVILDKPDLVAALLVSYESQEATLVDFNALYAMPFVVIHVQTFNPPRAVLEFYPEDPRSTS